MKKEIVIVMTFMLLFCGRVSFAQDEARFGLGVSLAHVSYADDYYVLRGVAIDTEPDDALMFGANFTHFLNQNFSFEWGVNYVSTDVALSAPGLSGDAGELTQVPFLVTMRLHFYTKPKVNLYVGLGAGYYFNSFDSNRAVIESIYGAGAKVEVEDDFAPHMNLGLEYLVSNNVAVNLDIKYIWDEIEAGVNVPGYTDEELDATKIVAGVGCKYYF